MSIPGYDAWKLRSPDDERDRYDPEEPEEPELVQEVECYRCHGEGRLYSGHPNDPDPRDNGPCPVCNGRGTTVEDVPQLTMDDLDQRCGDA